MRRPLAQLSQGLSARTRGRPRDDGFTLIELVIVVAIIPLIIGAISVALISVLTQQNVVSNKLSDSEGAQLTSTLYVKDVQSATMITTAVTPPSSVTGNRVNPGPCGTTLPIVSLLWANSPAASSPWPVFNTSSTPANGTAGTVVTYYEAKQLASSKTYTLYRAFCTDTYSTASHSWGSSSPAVSVVSRSVLNGLKALIYGSSCGPFSCSSPPCAPASCPSGSAPWTTDWTPGAGISSVEITVQAPDSGYTYTLTAVPRTVMSGLSQGGGVPPLLILGSGSGGSLPNCGSSGATGVCCKGNGQLTVNGTATIDTTGQSAAAFGGTGQVQATSIYTPGSLSGNIVNAQGTQYTSPTGSQTAPDPYAGMIPPATGLSTTPSVSPYQGYQVYTDGNLSHGPGIYTTHVTVSSSITIPSGVYIFLNGIETKDSGSNGGGINGTAGVLFYIYGGQVKWLGSGGVNLAPLPSPPAAPPNAPAPNIVLWQDQVDSNALILTGNGQATSLTGIVYAPTATIDNSGGGNATLSALSLVTASLTCPSNGTISLG